MNLGALDIMFILNVSHLSVLNHCKFWKGIKESPCHFLTFSVYIELLSERQESRGFYKCLQKIRGFLWMFVPADFPAPPPMPIPPQSLLSQHLCCVCLCVCVWAVSTWPTLMQAATAPWCRGFPGKASLNLPRVARKWRLGDMHTLIIRIRTFWQLKNSGRLVVSCFQSPPLFFAFRSYAPREVRVNGSAISYLELGLGWVDPVLNCFIV